MAPRILRTGHNVWRVERARRAAVLVDGAAFFSAVRAAFLEAQRSIFIVGWDIDSRTELRGADDVADDGYPSGFADFLAALVKARPQLKVHLLLWDYSLLYAGERELLPRLSLGWQTPRQIHLCLDNAVPFGCSQHQKIIVIDDAVALSGGLDVTIRRWDTSRHRLDEGARVDPSGRPYRPFHDVQMMVDGPAAHALARLARERWCRVDTGEPTVEPIGDPWPGIVAPDFVDVEVGIARTHPAYDGEGGVREAEALFHASIDAAEQSIYIENQFVTSPLIARRLARRLRHQPALEVVIVAPRSHDAWVERRTMRNGRIRFWRTLRAAGGGRVRLVYPAVEQGGRVTDTMIHSKVMVIDDRFLRIGSANLNNRSMGADTECDLAIEAGSDAERAAIRSVRDRLLGEHCGVEADAVAVELARHGSLVRAADTLANDGHSLRAIDDGKPDGSFVAALAERIADPIRPFELRQLPRRLLRRLLPLSPMAMAVGGIALAVLALALAWRLTGLSAFIEPGQIRDFLSASAGKPWAIALALGAFLLGGLVAFPVNILILATAAAFGPWLGLACSAVGAGLSALVMYGAGARLGRDALDRRLGSRWSRALGKIRHRGMLAVVALRVLPVAPFTLVNLAAGACGIRLGDFLLGTLLGMAPGMAALSFLGDRIVATLRNPTAAEIGLLALAALAWLALMFGAQALLARLGGRAS
jgi:phosphatidylserine/phosphatidylglycerophosphate/cardiolipin synthase-like enzyme/uncharacterized membrane protein YdjX (TVP38/TMEM64 family)